MTSFKHNVCVDFDGVLNTYTGWEGEDELFTLRVGVKEFLEKLNKDYNVVIFTVRDQAKVEAWLDEYDLPYKCITDVKLGAVAYIDDRSIRFDGNFNKTLYELEHFKPHWQKPYGQEGHIAYPVDENGDLFQLVYETEQGWWAVDNCGITLWKEEVVWELNDRSDRVFELENTIRESLKNEKTEFGQMILRQLADKLDIPYEEETV